MRNLTVNLSRIFCKRLGDRQYTTHSRMIETPTASRKSLKSWFFRRSAKTAEESHSIDPQPPMLTQPTCLDQRMLMPGTRGTGVGENGHVARRVSKEVMNSGCVMKSPRAHFGQPSGLRLGSNLSRQTDAESRASPRLAVAMNCAAMRFNNLPHCRQTQSAAVRLGGIECFEHF